jgi:hypothetical protein
MPAWSKICGFLTAVIGETQHQSAFMVPRHARTWFIISLATS